MKKHEYITTINWTGNLGEGTSQYNAYSRDYTVQISDKVDLFGSSDSAFRGDKNKHNPEDLLLASISSCHMLWFLHLATTKGIVVIDYTDKAIGSMIEKDNGAGNFESVTLYPIVTITDPSKIEEANQLHQLANQYCFIANSLNFKIQHQPICKAN